MPDLVDGSVIGVIPVIFATTKWGWSATLPSACSKDAIHLGNLRSGIALQATLVCKVKQCPILQTLSHHLQSQRGNWTSDIDASRGTNWSLRTIISTRVNQHPITKFNKLVIDTPWCTVVPVGHVPVEETSGILVPRGPHWEHWFSVDNGIGGETRVWWLISICFIKPKIDGSCDNVVGLLVVVMVRVVDGDGGDDEYCCYLVV